MTRRNNFFLLLISLCLFTLLSFISSSFAAEQPSRIRLPNDKTETMKIRINVSDIKDGELIAYDQKYKLSPDFQIMDAQGRPLAASNVSFPALATVTCIQPLDFDPICTLIEIISMR